MSAAPFHFYAPDVFQGTSTSGAAFLSYVPKIAGFIAILRVFGFGRGGERAGLQPSVSGLHKLCHPEFVAGAKARF